MPHYNTALTQLIGDTFKQSTQADWQLLGSHFISAAFLNSDETIIHSDGVKLLFSLSEDNRLALTSIIGIVLQGPLYDHGINIEYKKTFADEPDKFAMTLSDLSHQTIVEKLFDVLKINEPATHYLQATETTEVRYQTSQSINTSAHAACNAGFLTHRHLQSELPPAVDPFVPAEDDEPSAWEQIEHAVQICCPLT